MDFYTIKKRKIRNGVYEIFPEFVVEESKDLMVRGRGFYAVWDEEKGLWSTNDYDARRMVDKDLFETGERMKQESPNDTFFVKYLRDASSNMWVQFRKYMFQLSDNYHQLDETLTFSNTEVTRKDYVSKRLSYPLEQASFSAWEELVGKLFLPTERKKLEWAIGAIVAGDAKDIQKFIVMYGSSGTGKSTILNIIQKLFRGYYAMFEAKALTSNNNSFSTEAFRSNPLVGIQHDGDLSRIEDNAKLNAIISHEEMLINEKFKPSYPAKINCFLFMGSNKPVKITDAKSGIIRRLIDVRPSGATFPPRQYENLKSQIDFELGGIAYHCLEVYRSMGKNAYEHYRPIEMQMETDVFYNFVEATYFLFKDQEVVSLTQAYDAYKAYCEDSSLEFKLPKHKFRDELKNYFTSFFDKAYIDGKQVRSIFSGFIDSKFTATEQNKEEEPPISLVLDSETSLFDNIALNYPAQYASSVDQLPVKKWINVDTLLSDLNTNLLHYVKVPINHIVIDFDLEDETGEKSLEANLVEASKWPPTYAEYSKSHKGVHLHYIYDGDPERLSRVYAKGIEIKVFNGDASLRRQLSKCNNLPIAHLNSGLPLKGEKMIDLKAVNSERGLRELIVRNLNKEIHPGTKPSIDFIYKILEDAYTSGLRYDVTQLRPRILAFANNSTHQPEYCVNLVGKMKFQSEEESTPAEGTSEEAGGAFVFYDVEVFPNLFIVCWKYAGPENQVVRMINPSAQEIEGLLTPKMKLIGFNCRRYDNHILYARYIGYDLSQLYTLSQRIIGESSNAMFREAYNISFADIYDFSSKKQSLKLFEVELGLIHKELGFPWDQPVPEEKWHLVAEYCDNDVIAEEIVFEDRKQDFVARQILAELSGLRVNDTTQTHTAKIIFGDDPRPQEKFVYTDLSVLFPGYTFDGAKSLYRDENPGEGGYVYAEPGIYENVTLLDIVSMHPASIEALDLFGKYTKNYSELKAARIEIKHKNFDAAKSRFNGALAKYLTSEESADALAYALKIVINIVYGLTSARFPNKFKDLRNVDNIVAKRGALFMIDLKHAVQEQGFQVAHIKTDSIKIPNATEEIIAFVFDFGRKYGYIFEHEATYSKFCLVNNAVYIAEYKNKGELEGHWIAVGAEFAHPFVFKSLFSKEDIVFDDLCETKAVTSPSALYLDMNEELKEGEHNYHFVGKVGSFCPVNSGCHGGLLMREKEGKYYAATGTKGFRWLESAVIKELNLKDRINTSYYEKLVSAAINHISKFGSFDLFVSKS